MRLALIESMLRLISLCQVLAEARTRLDPGTVRILEKNLQVIERAIDDSKRALAVDPENAFLKDHLAGAYREKASYLREATDLVEHAVETVRQIERVGSRLLLDSDDDGVLAVVGALSAS